MALVKPLVRRFPSAQPISQALRVIRTSSPRPLEGGLGRHSQRHGFTGAFATIVTAR
jgi:hypothetical protein